MALSKTTQDHDEIREWAEKRGGKPSEVASTEKNGQIGIIRIEFPDAPHANDSALKEISWDDFFEKFDANGLSLVYQEVTKEGAESNFNKLIHPDPEETKTTGKKAPGKKAAGGKSTPAKSASKAPAKNASAKKTAPVPAKKTATKAPAKKSAAAKGTASKAASKAAATKSAPKKNVTASKTAAKKAAPKKTR